jgi:N-acetylmuramoyl-L-alanine amidase
VAAPGTPTVVHDGAEVSAAIPKSADTVKEVAETLGPASLPAPMHNGGQSLTRALGLKIGRIVIDAGHGGHDTGTIGPNGLMEKDVSLDVALRVGKLVAQRLPAAEIVYTRDDDTYVSLEKRTAIANQAKADLFLSIHANSSDDPATRGVETYYLNFSDTPEAMDVATRENAVAQSSVHDLQNLVSKIARNEKTEESHDFATDIQDSLAKHMENTSHPGPDRGVRKAPFVVLIGANMPSVLAEISFLSNPADEQWLKKSENRQHIAEGLYRGIEAYLQSTNSLAANLRSSSAAPSPGAGTPAARTAASRTPESQPASSP